MKTSHKGKNAVIVITKANGEQEPYSSDKLKASLKKSGADEKEIQSVIEAIDRKLYDGITTSQIYREAYRLLKKTDRHFAARYNLKRAIMELGPSGYPFEKFFAAILTRKGYKTQTGTIVQGRCISHEVDIIADKDDDCFMIECKYHNQPGTISEVKIPLYIQSRFKDIEPVWKNTSGHRNKSFTGWVVTNTRFSGDALAYGMCAGLRMTAWDYPVNESLKKTIDMHGLYPVTCLTSLTKNEKQALLQKNIVLCTELMHNENYLKQLGLDDEKIRRVTGEAGELCRNTQHITYK